MKQKRKILLLGATGRTGKLVLKKAVESGYAVNCLSRNSDRIEKQNGLTLFEGNPNHKPDLEKAISDCNAVISVLNISRRSDFPWAKLKTPGNYLSDVMKLLVSIAEKKNINRLAVVSAWGASETNNDIPKWFKWFIKNSNIGITYEDHERQEKLVTESKLAWTIIRPVGLTNSMREENIKETIDNKPKPSLTISRQSVAQYLVGCLNETELIRKKIVISKK
ncbi:MAG: NAD(P)-binding oxidoreductase [Bacteroidia bacterium]